MTATLQEVAALFRYVNREPALNLGPEDEVQKVVIREDKCWLIIYRARVRTTRNGYYVTHRGVQTILFTRTGPTTWRRTQQSLMDPLPAPEHHATWPGRTPEEHRERTEWEELCHRPGTHLSPMDNLDRIRQGY
jgi:hypothetical protein